MTVNTGRDLSEHRCMSAFKGISSARTFTLGVLRP